MRRTGAAMRGTPSTRFSAEPSGCAQEVAAMRRHSGDGPRMRSDPAASDATMPLWVSLRGAPTRAVAQWLAWTAITILLATTAGGAVGTAGMVVGILTGGWWLARRRSTPLDWTRRFHLDDVEVIALGPWRRIQRMTWAQVEHVTQERHALVLSGAGRVVALPLA